ADLAADRSHRAHRHRRCRALPQRHGHPAGGGAGGLAVTRGPTVLLLGRVALRHHDGRVLTPARLDRVVLAHLALAGGRALPAGDLLAAVWGPAPPATARNALQVKVSRLRRLLGEDSASLQHLGGGYRLALPA